MIKGKMSLFMVVVLTIAVISVMFCNHEVMAAEKTKVIKFSHPLPDFDIMVKELIKLADEFNAVAKGKYKIEVYPGGVLAGAVEAFEMVQSGALEACDFSPEFIAEKDLIFGSQNLPFAFKDPFAFQKFIDQLRAEDWAQRLEDKYNVKLMSLAACFFHDGWCGTKPIKTLEDWKGKVVWVASPVEAEAITTLGASPITMDWGDGYPAIEKGVVDGGTYGRGAAWMLKWSACKYFTVANMFSASAAVVMNKDVFNSMPKDLQDSLVNMFSEYQKKIIHFFTIEVQKVMDDDLRARGAEVYYPPADEIAKWVKATEGARNSYLSKLSPKEADMIKRIIAEANK